METRNIFSDLPRDVKEELFETLVGNPHVRIERIVSLGHSSPPGLWYDQPRDEWIILLRGAARIAFEEGKRELDLVPGDHVLLPARVKHRVEWTDPRGHTVWLAVHFTSRAGGPDPQHQESSEERNR
jgi:cupin 2 domain-containing protein